MANIEINHCGGSLAPAFSSELEEKLPVTSGFLEAIMCFYRGDYDTILSNFFLRKSRDKLLIL